MQTLILASTLVLSLVFAVAAAEFVLTLVLWLAARGAPAADSAAHEQPGSSTHPVPATKFASLPQSQPGITAVQPCGEPQT